MKSNLIILKIRRVPNYQFITLELDMFTDEWLITDTETVESIITAKKATTKKTDLITFTKFTKSEFMDMKMSQLSSLTVQQYNNILTAITNQD